MLTPASRDISNSATSRFPLVAAKCNGVVSLEFLELTSAPWSRHSLAVLTSLFKAAMCNTVLSCKSLLSTSCFNTSLWLSSSAAGKERTYLLGLTSMLKPREVAMRVKRKERALSLSGIQPSSVRIFPYILALGRFGRFKYVFQTLSKKIKRMLASQPYSSTDI